VEPKLDVLLVDDSHIALDRLEQQIAELDGLAIVGVASNGAAAVRLAREASPDLVLMDMGMPGMDALSALSTILSAKPWLPVVLLITDEDDPARADEAIRLGARQVLPKPVDVDALAALVESVRAERRSSEPARRVGAL